MRKSEIGNTSLRYNSKKYFNNHLHNFHFILIINNLKLYGIKIMT